MISRGRILRDTSQGDGLVFVNNNQYSFRLEGLWKSEVAPKVDMLVDVELDANGSLVSLRAVDPAAAAREQAAKFADAAGQTAKRVAGELQDKGMPVVKAWVALIGVPTLVGMGLVLLGWFFFSTVSMDFMGQSLGMTFYGLMKMLHNPQNAASFLGGTGGSAGLYGFITIVAFLAPLVPTFVKIPKAHYAYFAPLAWMAIVVLIGYLKMQSAYSQAADAMGGIQNPEYQKMVSDMASQARAAMMDAVSFGLGLYLAAAGALYLAYVGLKQPAPGVVAASGVTGATSA